jgi:hypothetical protein
MCVWQSGDIPRSTNVCRSGARQKRQEGERPLRAVFTSTADTCALVNCSIACGFP